jgi:hypothetical protein
VLAPMLAPEGAKGTPTEVAARLLELAEEAANPRPLIAAARALLQEVLRGNRHMRTPRAGESERHTG